MRLLIWHWGRNGAGPRYAAMLAAALREAGLETMLSLPDGAEMLRGADPPVVALPVRTYRGKWSFLLRLLTLPLAAPLLARRLRRPRPDLALCAMPALLDLGMALALARIGVRFAVVVHDPHPHPGERVPLQHRLQRALLRRAAIVVTLSDAVAAALQETGALAGKLHLRSALPPLVYGPVTSGRAPGPPRLLFLGRLLAYKGLDLLAEAWRDLDLEGELLVAGQGPESVDLDRLRRLPNARVENRWTPETEMAGLLAWCDAVVLPYRAATQSGVAAAALAAGRRVLATRVGGLAAQLAGQPGAILCDPDARSLRAGLRRLHAAVLAGPPPPADPDAAWRRMAAPLARALETFARC